MADKPTGAQRCYDALRHITRYESLDELKNHSRARYGLEYVEALEMAYENMMEAARRGIRGVRRPSA